MSVYVYRRHRSTGALELARELGGTRLRDLTTRPIRAGDRIICWGETLGARTGVHILNGAPIRTKYQDAVTLAAAGVPTVAVALRVPPAPPAAPLPDPAVELWEQAKDAAEGFDGLACNRNPVTLRGVQEFIDVLTRLNALLHVPRPVAPAVPQAEWLGRTNNHIGGLDLLSPPTAPAYYSRKEILNREFRVHSFLGRSIRAGVKAPREGFGLGIAGPTRQAHPWVRSYDGGWKIAYDQFESTRVMRDLAHAACTALGLQFGAVDLGEKPDGSLIVLEVNRAPGLEGGTVESYAGAIRRWTEGGRA